MNLEIPQIQIQTNSPVSKSDGKVGIVGGSDRGKNSDNQLKNRYFQNILGKNTGAKMTV